MSVPYHCPIGWSHWAPVENATLKTYQEEVQEENTVIVNKIFFFIYLRYYYFCITGLDTKCYLSGKYSHLG